MQINILIGRIQAAESNGMIGQYARTRRVDLVVRRFHKFSLIVDVQYVGIR